MKKFKFADELLDILTRGNIQKLTSQEQRRRQELLDMWYRHIGEIIAE